MYKYNFKDRENWIKSFQPNYNNQKWHNDKVYHPTEIKHFKYFGPYKNYSATINPRNIIGIDYADNYNYPSYGIKNIDWQYMLANLKRLDGVINNFKDQKNLIAHIHKDNDSKTVLKFGKHYFTTSGQHRLCLAKYLELDDIEVFVNEYKLDKEKFVLEKKIEKFYPKLLKYKLVKNEYKEIESFEFLPLNFADNKIWVHKQLVETLLKKYELIKLKKYTTVPNIIKSLFNTSNNKDRISEKNELYFLDIHILKHMNWLN